MGYLFLFIYLISFISMCFSFCKRRQRYPCSAEHDIAELCHPHNDWVPHTEFAMVYHKWHLRAGDGGIGLCVICSLFCVSVCMFVCGCY
jgi:hypothetical protein